MCVSTLSVPAVTLGWCPSHVSEMSAMLPHDGVIGVAATLVVHAGHNTCVIYGTL